MVDPGKVAHIVALMLGPTAVAAVAVHLPAAVRLVRRLSRRRRTGTAAGPTEPVRPPIERLAADLRRLLAQHEAVTRATGVPVRAARLTALRGAITDVALDAARAVGVAVPPRTGRDALPVPELARLLSALAGAGLVLPGHERFGRTNA